MDTRETKRMQPGRWTQGLMLAAGLLNCSAYAATFQSLISIQGIAEQHVRELMPADGRTRVIHADPLDQRLRLAVCGTTPEAFLPNGANLGSRATVGVRCNQNGSWTVYVPVSIETEVAVLMLNKALSRDSAVTAQDVEIRTQRVAGTGSTQVHDLSELKGQRLKRDLAAGTALAPNMLQPEILIRRGQQVTVLATVGGIEVRTQAVALTEGSANSRIRVKNLNSAKVVEGLVDTQNQVRVVL
ncbi:MAG: flagellar basal body P-ring formation chaperone FlgA [Steroidobacteraceae bacterium]